MGGSKIESGGLVFSVVKVKRTVCGKLLADT